MASSDFLLVSCYIVISVIAIESGYLFLCFLLLEGSFFVNGE